MEATAQIARLWSETGPRIQCVRLLVYADARFNANLEKYPLVPLGTPDPYEPRSPLE
jgi:hypothetical protein